MDDLVEVVLVQEESLPVLPPNLPEGGHKVFGNWETAVVRIICAQKVIKATEKHAKSDNREIGGILIGEAYQHEGVIYVEVNEYIPAPDQSRWQELKSQSSRTHFTFTHDIWVAMLSIKDQKFDQAKVVGWFHSHPGHGIFLSKGMDTKIQGEFFQQPWQIAMVYDPFRHHGGFFHWQDGKIVAASGFSERFEQGEAAPVITWKNLPKRRPKKRQEADLEQEIKMGAEMEVAPEPLATPAQTAFPSLLIAFFLGALILAIPFIFVLPSLNQQMDSLQEQHNAAKAQSATRAVDLSMSGALIEQLETKVAENGEEMETAVNQLSESQTVQANELTMQKAAWEARNAELVATIDALVTLIENEQILATPESPLMPIPEQPGSSTSIPVALTAEPTYTTLPMP